MTFGLKEFEVLKKDFDDTKVALLAKYGKKEIKELESPRKEQVEFLQAVIKKLDSYGSIFHLRAPLPRRSAGPASASLQAEQPVPNKKYNFYAALALLSSLVAKEPHSNGSLLLKRLDTTMGITPEKSPSEEQYVLLYTHFNQLLSELFIDNDPRKGFNKNHFLSDPSLQANEAKAQLKFIVKLVKASYLNEAAHSKAFIKGLKVAANPVDESKAKPEVKPFKAVHNYAHAVNPNITWDKLKADLHKMKLEELGVKNEADLDSLQKSNGIFQPNNSVRAIQLKFLETIKDNLQRNQILPTKDKIAILTGAMLLVREQIRIDEYSKEPLTRDPVEKSKIHTDLTQMINTPKDDSKVTKNALGLEDMADLLAATADYMSHMVIEKAPEGKTNLRKEHIFSTIQGFSFAKMMNLANDTIMHCRTQTLETKVQEYKKSLAVETTEDHEKMPKKPQSVLASASSLVGSMFSRSSKKPGKPSQDEVSRKIDTDGVELEDNYEAESASP